jgi:hypothetical protein
MKDEESARGHGHLMQRELGMRSGSYGSHDRRGWKLSRDEEEMLVELPREELIELIGELAEGGDLGADAVRRRVHDRRYGRDIRGTGAGHRRGGGFDEPEPFEGRSRPDGSMDPIVDRRYEANDRHFDEMLARHRGEREDRHRRVWGGVADSAPADRSFFRRFPERRAFRTNTVGRNGRHSRASAAR